MGLIRFIIWALFFYIVLRLIRTVVRVFTTSRVQKTEQSNVKEPKKKKSKIDQKDIIDAEFEEIKDQEKDNSQN